MSYYWQNSDIIGLYHELLHAVMMADEPLWQLGEWVRFRDGLRGWFAVNGRHPREAEMMWSVALLVVQRTKTG
jgi:hypothetical protein